MDFSDPSTAVRTLWISAQNGVVQTGSCRADPDGKTLTGASALFPPKSGHVAHGNSKQFWNDWVNELPFQLVFKTKYSYHLLDTHHHNTVGQCLTSWKVSAPWERAYWQHKCKCKTKNGHLGKKEHRAVVHLKTITSEIHSSSQAQLSYEKVSSVTMSHTCSPTCPESWTRRHLKFSSSGPAWTTQQDTIKITSYCTEKKRTLILRII